MPEVFRTLVQAINITPEFHLLRDGSYGSVSPNGTWNGVIGAVVSRKLDLSISDITVTPERAKVRSGSDFEAHLGLFSPLHKSVSRLGSPPKTGGGLYR